jgi:5-methylthioadenosine/S-adenosylhomocysteine deaminase
VALTLTGTVVTFDRSRPLIDPGAVYVGDDGRLAAVGRAADPPPAGFANAPRIDTGSVIYTGLIDLHNHFAYNTLPLWRAKGVPYIHHDRWPGETKAPAYSTSVTWPARVLGQAAPEALLKYVEVKALVGGTTSIQGAPLSTRPVDGWLLRIVDDEKLPSGKDLVMCAALQRDISELLRNARRTGVADKLDDGQVMIYHAGEGQRRAVGPGDFDVAGEFDDLASSGCLQPGLIGVHGARARRLRALARPGEGNRPDPEALARLVAVLELLALPRDNRRGRGRQEGLSDLPRLGLVAVGDQARARRA